MSRHDLGRLVGKKYSYIAELENGGMKGTTILHAFAQALGVNISWLETGKGERRQPPPETPSQSVRLDPAIVRKANAHLTAELARPNIGRFVFNLDLHAKLFALAYARFSHPSDEALAAELEREIVNAINRGRRRHGKSEGGAAASPRRRAS